MAHAEKSLTINRPVRSVYEFLLNGANNKLWRSSVLDIRPLGEAPYEAGAKFAQRLKAPSGSIAGDYEITECRPNELIRFQVTAGPSRPVGTYRLETQGAGTRVTFTLDVQPKGLGMLMNPLIQRSMDEEVGMLSELKVFLEKHA